MNNSSILKTILLSVAFALCLNVASAQKTKKTEKTPTETTVSKTENEEESAKEKEPEYKWVYSVATVMTEGKSFNIKFEETENKAREASLERSKEVGMKMQEVAKSLTSETDLLNLLSQQNLEIISVTNVSGKEGMMKYYLRTKVEK